VSAIPRSARIGTWFAAAAVAVFLVWAALRLDEIVRTIYASSDIASAPVIAELLRDRGSGDVILGYYPWLEPLFGLHLTRWVPSHRLFWEAEPFLVLAASVGLVWWSIRRTVSARAGLLVGLAMAAPAPLVLMMLGAPNMRGWLLLHATLLTAFVISAPAISTRGRGVRALWGIALAVTLAPGVSSDPLVVIGGVVPFLIAMAVGWRLKLLRGDLAALGALACLAGAAGGRLLEKLAEHHGFTYYAQDFGLTSARDAISNARLLLEDVALFAHGQLDDGSGAIGLLEGAIAIGMMVAVPILLLAIALRGWPLLADGSRTPAQRLLAIYWAAAAVAIICAFIASTAPEDLTAVRYMTVLLPALLSLVVIVWEGRALPWLAAFASGAAILGCIDLARGAYTELPESPYGREVSELNRFVSENDLDHGYAGYWDAATITYQSDYETPTYPVHICGLSEDGRCQFPFHTIDSWYIPKPGVRTFYLQDDSDLPNVVGPPPARWGRPFAEARIGDLRAYAYDYDLASVLEEGTRPPPAR
jgi:hypothetical protein